ncbi:FAD-binding and (Fe-S)-binding domain-containing protein [Microlunatus panaciterrae]|nr:FAD-binding and (Fe-S)-binding domain-containing protein [Microlunatus panaciterrae]
MLRDALGDGADVSSRAFDRISAAVDASHYLLTPSAVIRPRDAAEVGIVLAHARASALPLTFRSGGTSLSGQAVTDGLLVDTRRHFRRIEVLDDGRRVRVQPGATVRQVNARLARHGRKLGPDPASEIACTIGGVVANNSSGMACGITQNSYRTLESMIIVLPSGTVLDTADHDADEQLLSREPQLHATLARLRRELTTDPELRLEVERQYSMKNTMGYSLNALLDFEQPAQILAHLMIGSEGTLGFVAEATFRTVAVHKQAATAFCVFSTLEAATDALPALVASGATTIELLDAASLRVVQQDPAAVGSIPDIEITGQAALLVEYQAAEPDALARLRDMATEVLAGLALELPAELVSDPAIRGNLWQLRKGLYAAVAGSRPSGTTALLEDIAVPVGSLSRTCADLQVLFDRYGYADAVIFGHAKDGNIHFLINIDFSEPDQLAGYRAFTEEMVELVLAAGGTLKAEHGTGRIMAPFVRRQFGDRLYGFLLEIKNGCDPTGLLNPDTVLSSDAELHLKHLKATPGVGPEVDRCVECGYCEPVCPSRDLTTTPRQRIVVRRAMAEAARDGNERLLVELSEAADYEVVDTCAVDGMCQTACPVFINTGDLVRRLRSESAGRAAEAGWKVAAKAWGPFTAVAAAGMSVAAALPPALIGGPNRLARRLAGAEAVPLLSAELPTGGRRRRASPGHEAVEAVYFQACVGTMFGPADGSDGVAAALRALCDRAGIALSTPERPATLCCGTPWKSKGMTDGYELMTRRTVRALWLATDFGRLPVICDASSCTEGLALAWEQLAAANGRQPEDLRFVDAVQFVAETVLPRLPATKRIGSLALHPTCSSTRLGTNSHLNQIAEAIAEDPVVPNGWGCCGFAGDRGLLHPELTASATQPERESLAERSFDAYASNNRTCELGLTRATGQQYRHILELLEEATRPAADAVATLTT